MAGTVEFYGETFTLADEVSEYAFLEFAEAADSGLDAEKMAGMAAMLRLILGCVDPADVARFRACARKNRATSSALLEVVKAVSEQVTDRPTGRPADSSAGPVVIEPKSAPSVDDKVSDILRGRPDLQLAVSRSRTA